MKITCVMVASLDGKTTKNSEPNIHSWTSEEDAQHFRKLIEQSELIIMGKSTYEAAKNSMKHQPNRLRIVLTNDPKKYANDQIPNQLEFTNESPTNLVNRLSQKFDQALLVGGEKTNELFFKEHLVNKLFLTIEPIILGSGNGLAGNVKVDLKLESVEKLNENGTLLCKYKITTNF